AHGRGVVAVSRLLDPAILVRPVHEHVLAVRDPGEREVLALEVGRVVVAVADGYPFPDPEPLRLLQTAAARVPRRRRPGRERPTRDGVPVAEAEPGLAIARQGDRAAGTAQLVALEAQQVPMAVVGRDDEA